MFSQSPYFPVLIVLVVTFSVLDFLIFKVHKGSVCVCLFTAVDLAVLVNPCDLTNNCACLTDFVFWSLFEPSQLLPLATSRISVFACIKVGSLARPPPISFCFLSEGRCFFSSYTEQTCLTNLLSPTILRTGWPRL